MPDVVDQPDKPPRTWRPMVLWTTGILLALGLVWFVVAVAVPYFQVRAAVRRVYAGGPMSAPREVDVLGGQTRAAAKCSFYIRCPEWLANRGEKRLAFWILKECGSDAYPWAVSLMRSRDSYVRAGAAELLADLRNPRAADLLLGAIGDSDRTVRFWVVCALGQLKDRRAVEPLKSVLKDANADVRAAAAEALGGLKDARAVEPLISMLEEADPRIRRSVAGALGAFQDPRAVKALIVALQDPDAHVATQAWSSLGSAQAPHPVDPLIGLLKDPAVNSRSKGFAASLLGIWKESRALEPLIAALGDPDPVVSESAALGLGELKDPRAIKPLQALLQSSNKEIRSTAARAIRNIQAEEAQK